MRVAYFLQLARWEFCCCGFMWRIHVLQAAAAALAADSTLTPAQVGNLAAQAAVAAGQGVLTQDSEDVVMSCSRLQYVQDTLLQALLEGAAAAGGHKRRCCRCGQCCSSSRTQHPRASCRGRGCSSECRGRHLQRDRACVACLADE